MKRLLTCIVVVLCSSIVSCSNESDSAAQSSPAQGPKNKTLAKGSQGEDLSQPVSPAGATETISDYCLRLWSTKDDSKKSQSYLAAKKACSYACTLGEFPAGLKGEDPNFKEKTCQNAPQKGLGSVSPNSQECRIPDSDECKRYCALHPEDIACP